jgi:hypothetical protein
LRLAGVVAVIDGGRSRVIVANDGMQWIVQHWYGGQWRSRSFCRPKEALLRCCGHDLWCQATTPVAAGIRGVRPRMLKTIHELFRINPSFLVPSDLHLRLGDLHMRIERLEKRAIEKELVARLSSNEDVSLKKQERAELRSRIKELNRRLARLNGERGKE